MSAEAVYVRHQGGAFYRCRLDRTGWRCGRCLRGLIHAKKGARCRVCQATVAQVLDARYLHFATAPSTVGLAGSDAVARDPQGDSGPMAEA